MRRNQIAVFIAILAMISLTGCMDISELTEQQSNLIAEYSAGVLLRYSDRYERRLITKDQLEKEKKRQQQEASPEPTATAEPEETPQADSSNGGQEGAEPEVTQVPSVALNDIYQLKDVDVSCNSYRFLQKYGTTQIRAEEGETLCVVSFSVKNTSAKTKKINLMKRSDISYTLNVDGNEYQPGISILENGGMNQLSTTLKPGKQETAVLIFNMAEERKKASSISLTVGSGSKQSEITLK